MAEEGVNNCEMAEDEKTDDKMAEGERNDEKMARKEKKDEVSLISGEPGATRHGNFINYYKFHPTEERVRQLPRGVWQSRSSDRKYIGLDVGCNAGDLTFVLKDFLQDQLPGSEVNIFGVDLDPVLIQRARENITNPFVKFECLDFVSGNRESVLNSYLSKFGRKSFDVVFCFSISMWIHLNHGDEGLEKFLNDVCSVAEMLVIEPQPWKCYRNASRRMRRSGEEDFPLINSLKMTGDMNKWIEQIVCGEKCQFERVIITDDNNWGRKLLIFKSKN